MNDRPAQSSSAPAPSNPMATESYVETALQYLQSEDARLRKAAVEFLIAVVERRHEVRA